LNVAPATIQAIESGKVPKADPLAVARVAGTQAAKQTSVLIPYCHQVPLDFVAVEFELQAAAIVITTEVKAIWKTGVEMEALTAASAAALALYDMLKIIDESMEIVSVRLLEKKGGKSDMKIDGAGLKAAVLVMSDTVSSAKGEDASGKILVEKLQTLKFAAVDYIILPDDAEKIRAELLRQCDELRVDLILTTGGTGVSPRDVTPETTLEIITRRLPAVEETLHSYGQQRTATSMLSRGVAGIRGKTLIVNFPGSRGAAVDGMNALFPQIIHTFRMLKGEKH
jgi:molybdenum cofactor biosynthesis protein MoaC